MNPPKTHGDLTRIWRAFFNSMRGLKMALCSEPAFFQNTLFALALVVLGACLGVRGMLLFWIIGAALLLLIVELLNSAIESVVDLVTKDHHPLAGRAKDMASAAVFLAIVHALIAFGCGLWSVWGA